MTINVAPDPIFAAIEAHRAAHRAFETLLASAPLEGPDPTDEEQLSEAADAAAEALSGCKPTSKAGVLALLRYTADLGVDYEWLDEAGKLRPLSYWVQRNCADALEKIEGAPL